MTETRLRELLRLALDAGYTLNSTLNEFSRIRAYRQLVAIELELHRG